MKKTRKIFTRMLAVLMTVIMIVCALEPCAFAKTQETVKHYDVYTCLGDSHAAGYGTTGYVYSRIPAPNAYHSLVANAVGAKLNDYGVGGFRTHEISYMLDDNYDMDWGYSEVSQGDCRQYQLDEYRQDYRQAVIDADLITVQIGSNDFAGYLGNVAMKLYTPNESIEAIKACISGNSVIARLMLSTLDFIDKALKIGAFMIDFSKYCQNVINNYRSDFDEMMGNILRLNPDADIVVVGNFNPLYNAYLQLGEAKLSIGKIFDVVFNTMNLHLKHGSKYVGQYSYVDVSDMHGFPFDIMEFGDSEVLFAAVHQRDEGHAEIARRIVEVLEKE